MLNKLFSSWRGELMVADHAARPRVPGRIPGSRIQVATNNKDYHFHFEEFTGPFYKVRFYQFNSSIKDIFTWVSEPMITLRIGHTRSLIFQLPQLGKQVFHQRDLNLLHIPNFSVEFSLGPDETVSFMDIVLTEEYVQELATTYPRLLHDFVYKTARRLPAKLKAQNAIASIEILRWADKFTEYGLQDHTTQFLAGEVVEQLIRSSFMALNGQPVRKHIKLSIQEINKLYKVAAYLETFPKKVSVQQLADQFRISTYKLEKGFKEIFGYTVLRHAFEEKMRLAFRLIDDKRYSSKQVAKMLRYSVPQSFSRAFRKRFGYAPFRNARKS